MFIKYQTALRLKGYENGLSYPQALVANMELLLRGHDASKPPNMYTTTLHLINSAIVKLSKVSRIENVYCAPSLQHSRHTGADYLQLSPDAYVLLAAGCIESL
jgi:hypothetical protein